MTNFAQFLTHENLGIRELAKTILEKKTHTIIEQSFNARNIKNVLFPKVLNLGKVLHIKGDLIFEEVENLQQIYVDQLIVEGDLIIRRNPIFKSLHCQDIIIKNSFIVESNPKLHRISASKINTRNLSVIANKQLTSFNAEELIVQDTRPKKNGDDWDGFFRYPIAKFNDCPHLKHLPNKVTAKELILGILSIKKVPFLENVSKLSISSCASLTNFQNKKIQNKSIYLSRCYSLEKLPILIVENLEIYQCEQIREIPKESRINELTIKGPIILNYLAPTILINASYKDIPAHLELKLAQKPKKGESKNLRKVKTKPKYFRGRKF